MLNKKIKSHFQKIKVANAIAIGGMIGAGKSTLSKALGEALKAHIVYEWSENDELLNALLKRMYEGDKTGAIAFQVYFFCARFDKYRANVNKQPIVVFDRTIFEDRLFAHQNMTADPIMFDFYDSMWHDKTKELIYSVGVPRLYIILDIGWDDFKNRLFKRGRQSEINNFPQNEAYFHSLLKVYKDYLVDACQAYGIKYLLIDAMLSTKQQVNLIIDKIKSENLLDLSSLEKLV